MLYPVCRSSLLNAPFRIYHIERRAIFSKLWMLSAHVSRFQKPGDYLKLEIAGYSYFVILTKEGNYVSPIIPRIFTLILTLLFTT
jgi:phenylpropionate dioxygenase-like ring-hydroxylating dioxygenase large terminal subunit